MHVYTDILDNDLDSHYGTNLYEFDIEASTNCQSIDVKSISGALLCGGPGPGPCIRPKVSFNLSHQSDL